MHPRCLQIQDNAVGGTPERPLGLLAGRGVYIFARQSTIDGKDCDSVNPTIDNSQLLIGGSELAEVARSGAG